MTQGAGLPGRRLTYIARIRESFTLEESATTQRPSLAVCLLRSDAFRNGAAQRDQPRAASPRLRSSLMVDA
jgi:hypothetical protein